MVVASYSELKVWQKTMDLAVDVYNVIKKLPKEELYVLSDQIRRSVISIPSNIAEGQQRNTSKEFIHFLYIAKGSLSELETQIILCEGLEYLDKKDTERLLLQCSEIGKMLNGLLNKLKENL